MQCQPTYLDVCRVNTFRSRQSSLMARSSAPLRPQLTSPPHTRLRPWGCCQHMGPLSVALNVPDQQAAGFGGRHRSSFTGGAVQSKGLRVGKCFKCSQRTKVLPPYGIPLNVAMVGTGHVDELDVSQAPLTAPQDVCRQGSGSIDPCAQPSCAVTFATGGGWACMWQMHNRNPRATCTELVNGM